MVEPEDIWETSPSTPENAWQVVSGAIGSTWGDIYQDTDEWRDIKDFFDTKDVGDFDYNERMGLWDMWYTILHICRAPEADYKSFDEVREVFLSHTDEFWAEDTKRRHSV